MAKSNPIGVRFDLDLLEVFKEDKIADSPQKALNFLTEFYRTNRERIDFKKMFEESPLFKSRHTTNEETEVLNKAYKKTFSKKKTSLNDDGNKSGVPDPSDKAAYLKWLRTNK